MSTGKTHTEASIDMLVDKAHHFTQDTQGNSGKPSSWANSRLTLMATIIAAAAWAFHLTQAPSREAIDNDLRQMLMQAQASVESAMRNRNTLPDHLDDPHLAAVVQYLPQWSSPESGQHQYTLIARTGRYSMVWNSSEPQRFERQE